MFERFTLPARLVVVRAQEAARELKHNYIGTEHILLGLFANAAYPEASGATKVLEGLDITAVRVRAQIIRIIGQGEEISQGMLPFIPRAKRALELSLRESLHLGHNWIGPEHILLGLIRVGEGVSVRILADLGCDDTETLRNAIVRQLTENAVERKVERAKETLPLQVSPQLRQHYIWWLGRLQKAVGGELGPDHPASAFHIQLRERTEFTRGAADDYLRWADMVGQCFELFDPSPLSAMKLMVATVVAAVGQ